MNKTEDEAEQRAWDIEAQDRDFAAREREDKTEDWAVIAQAVRYADPHGRADQPALLKAADLCERYARGELVERTSLLRRAEKAPINPTPEQTRRGADIMRSLREPCTVHRPRAMDGGLVVCEKCGEVMR